MIAFRLVFGTADTCNRKEVLPVIRSSSLRYHNRVTRCYVTIIVRGLVFGCKISEYEGLEQR